jgi:hypothetical protein
LNWLIIPLFRFVREWIIPVIIQRVDAREKYRLIFLKIMEEFNLLVCLGDRCANIICCLSQNIRFELVSEKMRAWNVRLQDARSNFAC